MPKIVLFKDVEHIAYKCERCGKDCMYKLCGMIRKHNGFYYCDTCYDHVLKNGVSWSYSMKHKVRKKKVTKLPSFKF